MGCSMPPATMPPAGMPTNVLGASGGGDSAPSAPSLDTIVAQLRDVTAALQGVISALQGAATTGGGPSTTATCPMHSGAAMLNDSPAPKGAAAAPAPEIKASKTDKKADKKAAPKAPRAADTSKAAKKDSSASGLSAASQAGLDQAHQHGLHLISGRRDSKISGTNKVSDHAHGNAIDVTNGSNPTAQTREYADFMRQQGKAGKLNIEYVIHDDKIASARDGWAWRPYKPQGEVTPTTRHLDHVHVSFR